MASSIRAFAVALPLVFGAFMACSSDEGSPGKPGGDKRVVVLFTSDEHSHLFAFSPELDDFPMATEPGSGTLVGGVARRATVIAAERKAAADAGKDSILVSAGDNQMGCLPHVAFEKESIDYATMKTLGYDVTTFGNHEFDFGPKALANSINGALKNGDLPPIVASNVHFSGSAGDADLAALYSADVTDSAAVHPYRVLETKSGVKVGVFGYVGVNASHVAPNKTPVTFSEKDVDPAKAGDQASVLPHLYSDLQPVVDTLRNTEKVDLVVALAHGGINDTSSEQGIEAGDDWNVCKNVGGIDLIVSGHAHNADPQPITVTNDATQKSCLVLNASRYGEHLGRVEFKIPRDKTKGVSWDTTTQALIAVNDQTVPDPAAATAVQGFVETAESTGYLEKLLGRATGQSVTNDTTKPGDLYFFHVSKTDFEVSDTHSLLFLSADAMLTAADEWGSASSTKTEMGLESAGVIRRIIAKGKTGVISAADAFNVVPLGSSPVDGTIGYPLVRANLSLLELRAVFEFALSQGPTNSDFDLGTAGVRIEYDATRPLAQSIGDILNPDKGQVMRILVDSDHSDGFEQFDKVIYDRTGGISEGAVHSVVTSSYIAQFAQDAHATLKDDSGNTITLEQAILTRSDQSEIKQLEAFLGYLHALPNGTLPSLYDVTSSGATKRWVCTKGC